jgi:hypothetical protein
MATADSDARAEVCVLRQRAAAQRLRAARAASLASKYETRLTRASQSLWPLWTRLRDLHRQTEERHFSAARVIEQHAQRMENWLDRTDGRAGRPDIMAVVASSLGTPSATATLRGLRYASVLVAASDATARAAYELETVLAEGPAIETAATGTSIAAAGAGLLDRWPRYGSALAELGVRAVTAAPLGPAGNRLGALCAYRAEPVILTDVACTTDRIAAALTELILCEPDVPGSGAGGVPPVFDEAGYQAIVHQAAGMVSVQCDCDIDAAEDLLVARAFAVGAPVEQIAAQVVRGEINLR